MRLPLLPGVFSLVALACGEPGDPSPSPVPAPEATALLATVRARSGGALPPADPPAAPAQAAPPLEVTLPERGDRALTLRARVGGVSVRFTQREAAPVEAQSVDGHTVYPGPAGGGVVYRQTPGSIEDFVYLPARPRDARLIYDLELGSSAQGLRYVGGVLEVLDAAGVPRLRMDPPYVIDARGQRQLASLSVSGCEVDTSPAAPWRRPVVRPGSERCEVEVSWGEVSYPLVVDPAWKATSSLIFARLQHSAALLTTGDVLIAGGYPGAVAELYKPPAEGDYTDLGAFAVTGAMPQADARRGALVALSKGRAIHHGGQDSDNNFVGEKSWLYDAASGQWRVGPGFSPEISEHAMVLLDDGRVLSVGGETFTSGVGKVVALYDPEDGPDGSWTLRSPLLHKRKLSGVAAQGNLVVAAGGKASGNPISTVEVYNVTTDTWKQVGDLPVARYGLTATALLDGRVMIAGGSIDTLFSSNRVEALDPQTGQLQQMNNLNTLRGEHRAVRLSDGRVLLSAGFGFVDWLPNAELYDPTAPGNGTTLSYAVFPRNKHTLTWLGGMRALVAGGESNYNVTSVAELFQLYPQGVACTDDEECLSRHCADDVCCSEACDGECEACSQAARQTDEPDGVCAARAAGVSARKVPSPSCLDVTSEQPCGANGQCNGQARTGEQACQLQVAGELCGEQTCGAPTYAFQVCDGKGGCGLTACAPYARCESDKACATTCLAQSDCVTGYFCTEQQACAPLNPNGAACTSASACQSGHCVDGVCCDGACGGLCQACSKQAKGQGEDGVCGFLSAGLEDSGCEKEAPGTCGQTGACNGQGACAFHGPDTPCSNGDTCETQADGVAAVFTFRCAEGACAPKLVTSCGLFACNGVDCGASCQTDAQCAAGAYCDGGTCRKRQADGEACTAGNACASGVCADGVCCNTTCDGQCESCTQPDLRGTCVAVVGAPASGHTPCPAADPSSPCSASRCDGVERKSCAGFVADEQPCALAVCKPGTSTLLRASSCAGNGVCRPQEEVPCAPYACVDGACRQDCSTDADCSAATRCEGNRCVASARCEDATHLRLADGTSRACAPFRCDSAGRDCLSRCASSADCAPGSVCGSDERCAPPTAADPDPSSDAGCAVPPGGPRPAGPSAWWALLALGVAWRRRALAAALAAGPLACSSASPEAPDTTADPAAPLAAATAAAPLAATAPLATAAALSTPNNPRPASDPAARAPLAAAPGPALAGWPAALRAAIPAAEASGFDDESGALRPRLPTTRLPSARVALPRRADAPAELRDPRSRLQIAFRLLDAAPAVARAQDGHLRYPGALGAGTELLLRPSVRGAEDYVALDADAAARTTSLRYRVELGEGVAGLRQLDDTLEFMDASGAPRLRMAAPYGVRAGGERFPVAVAVSGCAVDTSPAAPWGRAMAAPGATSCEVRLSWAPTAGPLVIDPAWQVTGSMQVARAQHTATRLQNGRVLVVGGALTLDKDALNSCELYDPASGTWAMTGSLHSPRTAHSDWVLSDGRVMVAAGGSSSGFEAAQFEIYNPSTGAWVIAGSIPTHRYSHASSTLPDGRPFYCGGYRPSPDIFYDDAFAYDEATNTWSKLPGKMNQRRRYAFAFPTPTGKMLVASGKINPSASSEVVTATTELYDPVQGVWSAGPTMKAGRQFPAATSTPDGILFAGGIGTGFPPVLATVELYRFSDGTFVSLGSMSKARAYGTATWLPQEARALVAGGADVTSTQRSSELVATTAVPSIAAGDMAEERGAHTATTLDSGAILIVGGGTASLGQIGSPTNSAELFSTLQIGQPCLGPGQCPQADPQDPNSRYCVDGVCCDAPCNGVCQACTAARKGSGTDGACGAIAVDTDPDGECATEAPETCGRTGVCDGQGACQRHPEGTLCGGSCTAGQVTVGTCQQGGCTLASGSCGLYTCDLEQKGCRAKCATSEHCAPSAYCNLESEECVPRLATGTACTEPDSCASGHCVDGVCCNEACDTPCRACTAALQDPTAATQDGACLPSPKKVADPRGLCTNVPCSYHDYCDGLGACEPYTENETCSEPKCVGDLSIGYRVIKFTCQAGDCATEKSPQACEEYTCTDGSCADSCSSDADCSDRAYCAPGGKCVFRLDLGQACTSSAECKSGFCVDKVCCNEACEGSCGTCNAPDQEGRCVPVVGQPGPDRPACPAAPPGQPCQQRLCDGVTTKSCEGFVGTKQTCQQAGCADGRESSAALCDGQGACGEAVSRNCFPFVCGPSSCLTGCTTDADCATGNQCVAGACVALLSCDPARSVLLDSAGNVAKECGLYRCSLATGACLGGCTSSADCSSGAVCSSQGACEPPSLPQDEDSGCGCRVPASPAPTSGLPLALLSLLFVASRRRSHHRP